MRNLFLAAMAALAFLASCSTQNDEILASTEGAVVHVSFADDNGADTRAFFRNHGRGRNLGEGTELGNDVRFRPRKRPVGKTVVLGGRAFVQESDLFAPECHAGHDVRVLRSSQSRCGIRNEQIGLALPAGSGGRKLQRYIRGSHHESQTYWRIRDVGVGIESGRRGRVCHGGSHHPQTNRCEGRRSGRALVFVRNALSRSRPSQ